MIRTGHVSKVRRTRFTSLLGLMVVLCVGCGGPADGMSTVSGTVTLDGQPLADAVVEYSPLEPGMRPAYGKTDSSGHYTVMTTRSQEGAMPGEYEVRIRTGDITSEDGVQVNIPEVVPKNYNDETELKQTVEAGSNTHDYALETGEEVIQPDLE